MRHLLIVRPGFESDLLAEVQAAVGGAPASADAGCVWADRPLPPAAFVFERQRLPHAQFIEEAALKPVGDETFSLITEALRSARRPWTLHLFATDTALLDRMAGFARAVERLMARHLPDLLARRIPEARDPGDLAVQFCRTPRGLWFSTAPLRELSSPWIGGVPRLRDDPRAPSRSYLKLEEAFARMDEWPQAGQTAVDLGAAPGGWTLALIKRGCEVTAVDNGPLRLPPAEPEWGAVRYLRANGITFEARAPVDWLVADMLIAPGVALGLLRRWIERRAMRRLVVNIKIPQENAFAAIAPLVSYLASQIPHFRCEVRQLYHDRREVTVMGRAAE